MREIYPLWIIILMMAPINLFSQDGDLDSSFGSGGFVETDVSGLDFGFGLAQQSNGAILAAGTSEIEPGRNAPTLIRYLADGSLDASFGINGIVVTDFNTTGIPRYTSILVQEDQKIIAGGQIGLNTDPNIIIVRYFPNGDLDPSFGIDGITVLDLSNDDRFSEMIILDNGKILVAGITRVDGSNKLTFIRLVPDGNLDPSFGDNGILATDNFALINAVLTLRVLEDNKILVAGSIAGSPKLLKFEADGNPDLSFGSDGVIITSSISSYRSAFSNSADGKIIVGLNRDIGNDESEGYLKRFLPDGSLDTTFGENGEVILNYENFRPLRIIIQPNQQILVFGSAYYGIDSVDGVVVRFRTNGTLDTAFGSGGTVNVSEVSPSDFLLQEDGKIVWIGTTPFASAFFLVRYLNDPFTFGVEDQTLKSLKVYPNPVQNKVTVAYELIQNAEVPYQISDVSGKILADGKLSGNRTVIDFSSFQSGLYFLNTASSSLRLLKE